MYAKNKMKKKERQTIILSAKIIDSQDRVMLVKGINNNNEANIKLGF